MLLQLESISLPVLAFTLGLIFIHDMCDCSDGHSVSVSERDDTVRTLLESDKNSQLPTSIHDSQFSLNVRFSSSNGRPMILLQK